MTKYTHLELDKELRFLSGYYVPTKEVRLKYNGREVLYVVGNAVLDSACCDIGSFGYVIVPGYIVNWQKEKNKDGLSVSEVELISDKATQLGISKIIHDAECISQIEFW